MDRSDTDELNPLNPAVRQTDNRTDRDVRLPSCCSSRLSLAVGSFSLGLMWGGVGGLLLGATAVVLLQSLELLTDNKLLMDQLEDYIIKEVKLNTLWENEVHGLYISILAEIFVLFSSALSLVVGVTIGSSVYALVIKKSGEAAWRKAFGLAGPVCLIGNTVTGYLLGLTFESFLSMILIVSLLMWFITSIAAEFVGPVTVEQCYICIRRKYFLSSCRDVLRFVVFTLGLGPLTFIMNIISKTRLSIALVLIPMFSLLPSPKTTHNVKLTSCVSILLLLIITDIFNMAGRPIVSIQSPASINSSSVVLEAIFIGALTPQLLTVAVAMSLFVSWQRGGAGKICTTAAGTGTAVLGAVRLALPVLGPGPTIAALTGVTGAVGVSLSAAGAAADHYGRAAKLGVVVGAAVGAFMSSCVHSGLSGMFMIVCGTLFSAGHDPLVLSVFIQPLLKYCGQCVLLCPLCICLFLPLYVFFQSPTIGKFLKIVNYLHLRFLWTLAYLTCYLLMYIPSNILV